MMIVFEVYLAPGADPEHLLSQEILRQTQAQVMTLAEAKKVGFGGLPEPPAGTEVRLVAVAKRDAEWIRRTLEVNDACGTFRVHEVG
jgi:hypothetical protein